MLKFVILIFFICAVYVLWRIVSKHKKNTELEQQSQHLSQLSQTNTEEDRLPEKTQKIKQIIDEERKKSIVESVPEIEQSSDEANMNPAVEVPITDEDQRLFDAAANLFFENALQIKDFAQANHIQHDMLSKMPLSTLSQVADFDGGEWSVFWHYHDQSLEYYVGRYGVFYAHVDRQGIEHKAEFKKDI